MGSTLQDEGSLRVNLVRPPVDHRVDRSDVEVRQRMELTDTNRPRACFYKDATRPLCGSRDTVGDVRILRIPVPSHLHRVSVAMAKGKHPAPFRTRKLSLSAPIVLQVGTCGRLGRCRTYNLPLEASASKGRFFYALAWGQQSVRLPRPHITLDKYRQN